MTTGPDSGPAGEAGPRDWGAWPDSEENRRGRRGRGARSGRARGRRAGRFGEGRETAPGDSGQGSGFLPDGPVEGSAAARGPGADPQAVARAICLRLLTMAPRTRAQLAEALQRRAVPQEAAEAVLERFSEVGLIDDEAFAEAWVASRHTGRGLARKALASELRHRGVDEDIVKDAVEQLGPEQEAETARALVMRKLSSTRGLDPAVRTRRLAGMLARKGYGPGLAFRVIREALESEEADNFPSSSSSMEEHDYPED